MTNRRTKSELDDHTVVLVSVAKRQWERTFDAISDPLMIIDEDYVIRRANLALADDLGVAVQRVVGRTCHELRAESERAFTRPATGPCAGCPVATARAAGGSHDAELASRGGRHYRLRAYPLDDDAGKLMVCAYRDVTEERAMSRQLANAEKLAAIGRLAGGVAHEINNPLGGILAFTQILLKDDVTLDERGDYLSEIEKSALRCKAIVESLLRFARQSPITPRSPISLNDVIREALRFAHYKFPTGHVSFTTRLQDALPLVLGNANQMEQILINLLSNAFDAVSSGAEGHGDALVQIVTRAEADRVILEVTDNGPGIRVEALERLYDPFFTTKEEGKGTGLGLAVTYAIVQEHGGRISAVNRPQGGATFTVSFPRAPSVG